MILLLPDDCIFEIIQYLFDYEDILSLLLVNKYFYNILNNVKICHNVWFTLRNLNFFEPKHYVLKLDITEIEAKFDNIKNRFPNVITIRKSAKKYKYEDGKCYGMCYAKCCQDSFCNNCKNNSGFVKFKKCDDSCLIVRCSNFEFCKNLCPLALNNGKCIKCARFFYLTKSIRNLNGFNIIEYVNKDYGELCKECNNYSINFFEFLNCRHYLCFACFSRRCDGYGCTPNFNHLESEYGNYLLDCYYKIIEETSKCPFCIIKKNIN